MVKRIIKEIIRDGGMALCMLLILMAVYLYLCRIG